MYRFLVAFTLNVIALGGVLAWADTQCKPDGVTPQMSRLIQRIEQLEKRVKANERGVVEIDARMERTREQVAHMIAKLKSEIRTKWE